MPLALRLAVLLALTCQPWCCSAFTVTSLRPQSLSQSVAAAAAPSSVGTTRPGEQIVMKQQPRRKSSGPSYERFSDERIATERAERKAINDKVIPALAVLFAVVKLAGGFDMLPESSGPSYGPPGLAKVQEWKTTRGGVNRLPQAMPSRAGQ